MSEYLTCFDLRGRNAKPLRQRSWCNSSSYTQRRSQPVKARSFHSPRMFSRYSVMVVKGPPWPNWGRLHCFQGPSSASIEYAQPTKSKPRGFYCGLYEPIHRLKAQLTYLVRSFSCIDFAIQTLMSQTEIRLSGHDRWAIGVPSPNLGLLLT